MLRRLLLTLKLVCRFKTESLLFLSLLWTPILFSKTIDFGYIKIEERIYFASEIMQVMDGIEALNCIIPNPLLFKSLEINGDTKIAFSKYISDRKNNQDLKRVSLLMKIIFFLEKSGAQFDKENVLEEALVKCNIQKSHKKGVKELLAVENFLKIRFYDETEQALQLRKETLTRKLRVTDSKELELALLKDREESALRSVRAFLQSINQELKHLYLEHE